MKIGIVIPNFYPAVVYGGWVFSSHNTCKEMATLGIECYVSTTNDNGSTQLKSNTKSYIKLQHNIYVKYYPQTIRERFSFQMLINLWRDIKKVDIVHVQGIFSASTPIALFYSSLLKKKVLLSPHGCLGSWCLADGSSFKKLYLKLFVTPFAHKVLWHVTALQEKNEILTLYPAAKVAIVPNGINVEEFTTPNVLTREQMVLQFARKQFNPAKVIISMSRLHRKKGLDILIKAFKTVLESFPTAMLLIAGEDFGEKKLLETIVDQLQLNKHVYFVGQLEKQERIDFFANADVFALPSHNENFGLVYAEAMAAGTPVLASTFTPWEEVEQLKIGKWVPNTVSATAQGLIDLLHADHKVLGGKAKTFIASSYSWQSVGKKFQRLFEEMIQS